MLRFIELRADDGPKYKYKMVIEVNGVIKKIGFGAKGYSDYTIHQDPERKKRYIKRHQKNEDWTNPLTPGALSRWILWNKPNLEDSLIDYLKKFDIK
jgi:hypothetical protein